MHRWKIVSISLVFLLMVSFILTTPESVSAANFVVTNTNNSGVGSLRQAMMDANGTPGLDTINFNIPGAGPYIIQPLSELPEITDPVIIDGYTQPGTFVADSLNPATLMIVLDGTLAGPAAGLPISAVGNTIRGLVINNFNLAGIRLAASSGSNTISGNYIGIDVSGTTSQPNRWGIYVNGSSSSTFGGTTPDARNLISGNTETGIQIDGGSSNTIVGNYIGTDASGSGTPGVQQNGIILGGSNNIVGGTSSGARNIISGNGNTGIMITGASSTGNQILGNYIGTNSLGNTAIANGQGILVDGGPFGNFIGGVTAGAGNLISGNFNRGIQIGNFSENNQVLGNLIGTDASGTSKIGNIGDGIDLGSSNNIIGGILPGARNVISGNSIDGIVILNLDVSGNQILGNYIGTDITGTIPLGNSNNGVRIWAAHDNIIGGTLPGAENVISGNGWDGVHIYGASASNIIQGNYIGTNKSGVALGNSVGINIYGNAANNVVGPDNKIWFNTEDGVQVTGNLSDFNTITENSITGNGVSGIDLENNGNDNIQPPAITSVTVTTVTGTAAPEGRTVEIFQDAGNQGKIYIGSAVVSSGSFSFNGSAPAGGNITATVTDPSGNTSEFSLPVINNLEPQPPGGETEVGGDIYPVSKVMISIPWIGLVLALIVGSAIMIRRYRA